LAAVLFAALWTPAASAQCAVATTGFAFGNYDVFSLANRDSTGTFTVSCSTTVNARVTLGPSTTSGNIVGRQMRPASGPDRLNYNLFINSARTNVWGDGVSGGSALVFRVVRGRPAVRTIFGRIPPGQDVAAGIYSDQVVITVAP
jgi:spore coat protein U-like protein